MSNSVNLNTINQLKEILKDGYPSLIETFLVDCEKRLVALNLAIIENNSNKIKKLAHSFKGSCSSMGAEQLALISLNIESMADNGDMTEVSKVYRLLSDEYQHVKDYLNSIN